MQHSGASIRLTLVRLRRKLRATSQQLMSHILGTVCKRKKARCRVGWGPVCTWRGKCVWWGNVYRKGRYMWTRGGIVYREGIICTGGALCNGNRVRCTGTRVICTRGVIMYREGVICTGGSIVYKDYNYNLVCSKILDLQNPNSDIKS